MAEDGASTPSLSCDRTVARALQLAGNLLARRGLDCPALSAQLLLAEVLGMRRVELLLERSRLLTTDQWRAFWRLLARRSLGEPVACILGRKEFYGREFTITPAVLTPRPETEHLVEAVLQRMPQDQALRFADLGTGSGILAVTLALELPRSHAVAVDICPRALDTARGNARRLGAVARLHFVRADFAAVPLAEAALDFLVANPPYVSEAEYAGLSPEVIRFEPRHALVPCKGGRSGLEDIQLVLQVAAASLRPGGLLALELGCTQGRAVLDMAGAGPWKERELLQDLAGLDRVFVARKG